MSIYVVFHIFGFARDSQESGGYNGYSSLLIEIPSMAFFGLFSDLTYKDVKASYILHR